MKTPVAEDRDVRGLFRRVCDYATAQVYGEPMEYWAGFGHDGAPLSVSVEMTHRGRWELLVVRGVGDDVRDVYDYAPGAASRADRIAALVALARSHS